MALGKDPALPSAFAMTLGKELKELKKYIYTNTICIHGYNFLNQPKRDKKVIQICMFLLPPLSYCNKMNK